MFVIFFLFDVVKNPLMGICLLIIGYMLLCKRHYIILCVAISLSGFNSIAALNLRNNEFTVKKIHESYTVYQSQSKHVLAWHHYEGNLDDTVTLEGRLLTPESGSFNAVQRISYEVEKPQVTIVKSSKSYRSRLFNKLISYPKSTSLILNESIDDIPMLSSLSLQVSGILIILNTILNRKDYLIKVNSLDVIVVFAYGLVFGFSYSLIRILLSKKIKPEVSGLLMLVLFPGTSLSFHFLFPYSLTLLKSISIRFRAMPFKAMIPFLSLMSQNRFNLVEALMYPIFKLVSGMFTLCLITLPMSCVVIEPLIDILIQLVNIGFLKRFELNGNVSWILMGIILFTYASKKIRLSRFLIFLMVLIMIYPPYSRVVFLDVGQGDATLIQAPFDVYNTLIDTGSARSYKKLKRKLQKYGVKRINQIIITHDDEDHNGNLEVLQKDFKVDTIVTELKDIKFLNGLSIDREYEDTNSNSLLMSLQIKDTSFLFTGDAGTEQERLLLRKYSLLESDVLKLGHHGSNSSNSKELIKSVQAKYAIASSNPNIYGHPHKDVKKNLHQQRVKLLQTGLDGDIVVQFTMFFDFIHTESKGFAII